MEEERLLAYHRFTREHGVNRPLYLLARLVLVPFLLLYFRLTRIGREHSKVKGPLIVVANHRSFLDPFVIGSSLPWRRPLHYVAKVELFEKRWRGWILNRLGAYPVRRGQSDEETLITSRDVLERGGAVCIFPEGTRHRTGSLARPKRGFGRLALETGAAVLLARGGLEVQLGTRTPERAEEMRETRANEQYLPGVPLPETLAVKRAADIELAGIDLVCLAIPSAALPQAVGAIGDRVGQRTSVLLLSKGMVAPMAALPSEYVSERILARAIASLGGPAHAREAVSGTAALVLGSRDADLRDQLGSVFDEAGLVCERSEDMIGVEVAGAAKNAAALAGAAAQSQGMNAAGIATAQAWRECVAYARARGAEHETFAGIAGVGDLTATILAEGSRNRRAGELLGEGTPAEQIPGIIGQASEALASVPLIAQAVRNAGMDCSALEGLAGLIAGEISPGEWMARVRQAERLRREPTAGGQAAWRSIVLPTRCC